MPVTRSRTYNVDMEDSHNTTGFLFGDDDANNNEARHATQANPSEGFPTLLRQSGFPIVSSASFIVRLLHAFQHFSTSRLC